MNVDLLRQLWHLGKLTSQFRNNYTNVLILNFIHYKKYLYVYTYYMILIYICILCIIYSIIHIFLMLCNTYILQRLTFATNYSVL